MLACDVHREEGRTDRLTKGEYMIDRKNTLMRGTLPNSRRAITGDLIVLREYSCGCIIYLDAAKQEINEKGIFCGHDAWAKHRSALVKGEETQVGLFAAE